jgi:hypothetical protein
VKAIRLRGVPEVQRFLAKFEKKPDGCWHWTGGMHLRGYGCFCADGRRRVLAHRYSYQHFVGPVPEGLELDHLCRVRHCVNPAHLEAVTHLVNLSRSIRNTTPYCSKGHAFDGTNGKHRTCSVCIRRRKKEFRMRAKARAALTEHTSSYG